MLMFLVIQIIGPYAFQAGAFELETSVKFNFKEGGKTVLHFPPLGRVSASTHVFPLELHLILKNIHLNALESFNAISSAADLPDLFMPALRTHLFRYLFFLLFLSFWLGAGSALLWRRQHINLRESLNLGLTNLLVLVLLFLGVVCTYDIDHFNNVKYEGMLEAAPLILGIIEDGPKLIHDLGLQFGAVVGSVSMLQQEIESADQSGGIKKDTLSILHVSDIHNNPAAFNLIRRLIDIYNVDIILDTGDMVDFGTTLELKILEDSIRSLAIPYIFVPGNHESPAVVEHLKRIANVNVIEAGIVEVDGLRIAAMADPASSHTTSVVSDLETLDDMAKQLYDLVADTEGVHLIAAHNPAVFRFLRNNGNVLVGGHIHRPQVIKGDGYVEINAGSSGASGIRGLQGLQEVEMLFSFVLIHFTPAEEGKNWRLYAADLVTVKQFPLHFSFERFIME